jgi:NADH dehydrogenase
MRANERHRVVVVGAGFGGLSLAKGLKGAGVDLTIVDRNNFHTFQPLLYQVATSGLGADDVAHNVRGIFHERDDITFRLADVTGIDHDRRELLTDGGPSIPYDTLVLAAGASTNTYGVPGVDEYAFAMKTLPEAIAVRNHVLAQFEAASLDPRTVDDGALNVVVIGGGPTGVELAGAMRELFSMVLSHDYPELDVTRARVILVEATGHVLGPFSPASRWYAKGRLTRMGVEVRLDAAVGAITPHAVHLTDGEVIPTRTAIWVAGVRANALADALGLAQTKGGRIEIGRDLTVPGHPEIFVVGDLGATPDVLPQLAPVAIQQGTHVAKSIRRRLDGRPLEPFRYFDKGTMATIGRDAAVAELPLGIRFRGRLAWVAWLFLHLMYLVGFRNRLNVFVNWAYSYITWDRGARLIVRPDRLDRLEGGTER